jgi:hypothetical protein
MLVGGLRPVVAEGYPFVFERLVSSTIPITTRNTPDEFQYGERPSSAAVAGVQGYTNPS